MARSFLKTYLQEYLRNEELKIPKIRGRKTKRMLRYLKKEELDILLRRIDNLRDRLMVSLMFEGGLRVSELLSIRPRDVFFKERTIRIIGKGNKEREVNFRRKTEEALTQWIEEEGIEKDDRIFSLTRKQVYVLVRKWGDKALEKKVTPHFLRHSCGAYLRKQGMDLREIQEYLGHSGLESTQIYTELEREDVDEKWRLIMEEKTEGMGVTGQKCPKKDEAAD